MAYGYYISQIFGPIFLMVSQGACDGTSSMSISFMSKKRGIESRKWMNKLWFAYATLDWWIKPEPCLAMRMGEFLQTRPGSIHENRPKKRGMATGIS